MQDVNSIVLERVYFEVYPPPVTPYIVPNNT